MRVVARDGMLGLGQGIGEHANSQFALILTTCISVSLYPLNLVTLEYTSMVNSGACRDWYKEEAVYTY